MNKYGKRNHKVTKVEGLPPAHSKVERDMAASPIFAKPYGKGKPRNEAAVRTLKKFYSQKPKCRKCNNGVLERRQWNTLNCTNIKCNHKELQ